MIYFISILREEAHLCLQFDRYYTGFFTLKIISYEMALTAVSFGFKTKNNTYETSQVLTG